MTNSATKFPDGRLRMWIPLASGEIDLIRRALRVYAHSEQEAMQSAACARDQVHAADVARQVRPRIAAAGELMDRLLTNPTLESKHGEDKAASKG